MERMKAKDFNAIQHARDQGKQSRPGRARGSNKYGATRTTVNGTNFDSKAEAKYYGDLCRLEGAGLVSDIRMQVSFTLRGPGGPLRSETGRVLTYKADFVYLDVPTGREVIVDVKGAKTKLYKLKKAIMESMGHVIEEVAVS